MSDALPSTDATAPATTAPVISVIVVSYNTRAMTLDCLTSLDAQTATPHEVIVVDNASTDGSAEAIASQFPRVRLIADAVNHGFGKANNIAAAHARGEYILLLNPDTVVIDRGVDRLLEFARQIPHAGIWGGRTFYRDMSLNATSCYRRVTLWNLFCRVSGLAALSPSSEFLNGETYGTWQRDTVRAVDIVTGCFLLMRRTLWDRLGGFDPAFFMYGEEADLCLRARILGADPHVTPDAYIIHHGSASDQIRSERLVKLLSGKIALVNRHFPAWQRPLGRGLFRVWPLTRMLASRTLGALTRREAAREAAIAWTEIWSRRLAWRDGYPLPKRT